MPRDSIRIKHPFVTSAQGAGEREPRKALDPEHLLAGARWELRNGSPCKTGRLAAGSDICKGKRNGQEGMRAEGVQATGLEPGPQSAREGRPPPPPRRPPGPGPGPGRLAAPPPRPWGGSPRLRHQPPYPLALPDLPPRQALRFRGAEAGPARRLPPPPRVSAAPHPGPRSPVAAAGPLTCTCLRKWHGPGAAGGQEQQQEQPRRWPRHLAHRTARGRLSGGLPSVRPSVAPAALTLPQRHRAGRSGARVASAKPQPGSRSAPAAPATEPPSFPPASPPPPPLNSSNGSSPAAPGAPAAALPPP